MQYYMKDFERIIHYTEKPTINSTSIHELAHRLIWKKPSDRIHIIEAKFNSLVQVYMDYFQQQAILNEQTLDYLTSAIPNDTLMIRYAYHASVEKIKK